MNGEHQGQSLGEGRATDSTSQPGPNAPPAISLPKGGGAIRGIGEKFAANPVTGTGSLTVPIATSPGRSGFGPQLSLSYDSGSGNGPFGLGWSLSLPSITRKTDKGLPKYQDETDSDEFILSGAEDLVPVLVENVQGAWDREDVEPRTVDKETYSIQRYRPRIEGLFARIERWANQEDPADTFWRSISKDNITTWYGKTDESRIRDPDDHTRIFSWLICESYDDKGNAIVYQFAEENGDGVELSHANERNRMRSANRYLKRIKYGNSKPYFPVLVESQALTPLPSTWLFEVVFDYGDGYYNRLPPNDPNNAQLEHQRVQAAVGPDLSWNAKDRLWGIRSDPFSAYRAGFEVRTYRRCQRVLMFHRFSELGTEPCLVRSTEFHYDDLDYKNQVTLKAELKHEGSTRFASKIRKITQSGYVHHTHELIKDEDVDVRNGVRYVTYIKKSLPPLEFEYSKATIQQKLETIERDSLENLPQGLDGSQYQWADLDGVGAGGILTEQAGAWFYKRNLSPLPKEDETGQQQLKARFGPAECISPLPSFSSLASGAQQILDLAADGQVDVVTLDSPAPGFFERTQEGDWQPHKPFKSLPNIAWKDPNLKFVDLTGDGHADIFITEDEAFTWYFSLAEAGFAPAQKVHKHLDEEQGPKLVFADGSDSIYLSDLSGDGLSDLVRIRNGEVCYWPNLGYSRFGAKVTMDNAPSFDTPDQFDQKRIRFADIDGSGVTDILYLRHNSVDIYLNQSGNRWADVTELKHLPAIDNTSNVMVADLMGNGTACLVWSSPLASNASSPMRYVDLMGGQKPHLLTKSINNLGAETHIHYAPSTKFYLKDKQAGKEWITRLHFPVHVVERVETYDYISHNRFATRYAYHHGYFDGVDREFRGFGMVEQWDTEEYASLTATGELPAGENIDLTSHVPPVHTKTWFHTGIYLGRNRVSKFFAGLLNDKDVGEYYPQTRSGDAAADAEAKARLLDDTILPNNWSIEEEREACRALKGQMLRQEVYADDGTDKQQHPYTVTEQNFTIKRLQAKQDNPHAVFFTHARETINYHFERTPNDPRIQHALTLQVDNYGNVLKTVAVAYGRKPDRIPFSEPKDREKQSKTLVTYTENTVTNAINVSPKDPQYDPIFDGDNYRSPLPCESQTFELTNYIATRIGGRFRINDFVQENGARLEHVYDQEINYEDEPDPAAGKQRRLIEHVITLYRHNKLTGPLAKGDLQSLALPYESYKLAFTRELINKVYQRNNQPLLPLPENVLVGTAVDQGGYVNLDNVNRWWIPSGRSYFSHNPVDSAQLEEKNAKEHFYLPQRYRDPFGHNSTVTYDGPADTNAPRYDLLISQTSDALNNIVSTINDYRVLQPKLITDPNNNRSAAAFDALGLVVATAVMGKETENEGDTLEGFQTDLTSEQITNFYNADDPHDLAKNLLNGASSRIIYDLHRFYRSRKKSPEEPEKWQASFAATIARETHFFDLPTSGEYKAQINFSYSDGFGREILKKIQAETGPLTPGGLNVESRWVGSGWTIFNNKGKPVRQYEPYFSQLTEKRHQYEFGVQVGVSPILFYDPVGRVVATIHPNHTYEKVLFDQWYQTSYDVNDTVQFDPAADNDIKSFLLNHDGTTRLASNEYLPTWYQLRTEATYFNEFKKQYPDAIDRQHQVDAANKAAAHADTPSTAHMDTLGRPFLSIANNGKDKNSQDILFKTRTLLDIEGNQRKVIDAKDRIVMTYDYTMVGPEENKEEGTPNQIYQLSMEAGARWVLNDVMGNPIRSWDSRGHSFITEYDTLRRPLRTQVIGADPDNPAEKFLTQRLVYGEQHPRALKLNLRGKLYLHLDQAGVVTTDEVDFKGNPLQAARRLVRQYEKAISWRAVDAALPADAIVPFNAANLEGILAPLLEADTYTSHTTYDALNRPLTVTSPDGSIYQPTFNEANLLNSVEVNLKGKIDSTGHPIWTPFVKNIDYDAKGQRERIDYANNTSTLYQYDLLTFRLSKLITVRGTGINCTTVLNDAEREARTCPKKVTKDVCRDLQNLSYTYDPAGNFTHIRDDAQQTVYFNNQCIEPSNDYCYDAIYRLIEATGREQLSDIGGSPVSHSYNDVQRVGLSHPGDGNAVGRYCEKYLYDEVGNFLEMSHHRTCASSPAWKRSYSYNETSLIKDESNGTITKYSNRLSSTVMGNGNTTPESYAYDAHGNMLQMSHLQKMQWDYKDQLQMTQRQSVNNEDEDGAIHEGEKTFYVYDASGQRVRKVTLKVDGTRKDERIYLGGYEIYIAHAGTTPGLVRETLHIMDDKQRVALVENRNYVDDGSPEQIIRYQFGNHLGSASLELDQSAKIISYEEYTPYGSSSYQAVDKNIKAAAKRYRYSGKERDEDNGFYYYGARYYAGWLGRWLSADPSGLKDGVNVYVHVRNRPITLKDDMGMESVPEWELSLSKEFSRGKRGLTKALERSNKFNFRRWLLRDVRFGIKDLNSLKKLLGLNRLKLGLGNILKNPIEPLKELFSVYTVGLMAKPESDARYKKKEYFGEEATKQASESLKKIFSKPLGKIAGELVKKAGPFLKEHLTLSIPLGVAATGLPIAVSAATGDPGPANILLKITAPIVEKMLDKVSEKVGEKLADEGHIASKSDFILSGEFEAEIGDTGRYSQFSEISTRFSKFKAKVNLTIKTNWDTKIVEGLRSIEENATRPILHSPRYDSEYMR